MSYKPTLCLDFDGVLHSYTSWNENIEGDLPVQGARRFCRRAEEYFTLVVFSSRAYSLEGERSIRRWLHANHFPNMEVTSHKPIAFLTLDDRAMTFTGSWPRIHTLRKFQPWWKRSTNGADASAVSEGSEEEDEEECEVEGG